MIPANIVRGNGSEGELQLTNKKSNGSGGQYPSQNYLHHQIYQHKPKPKDGGTKAKQTPKDKKTSKKDKLQGFQSLIDNSNNDITRTIGDVHDQKEFDELNQLIEGADGESKNVTTFDGF